MGNMTTTAGAFYPSSSGAFSPSPPDSKYYNSYLNDNNDVCTNSSPNLGCLRHYRGKLGDATRETLSSFGTDINGAWYSSNSYFPNAASSWFVRGSHAQNGSTASIFAFFRNNGAVVWTCGFRVVMNG